MHILKKVKPLERLGGTKFARVQKEKLAEF